MRESTTLRILGMVEFLFGVLMVVPALVAFAYGEEVAVFLCPAVPLVLLGAFQYFFFKESASFRAVNGLLLVGVVWLVMFLVSTFPYMLHGMSPVDAVFEAVSGVTTTGLTVITDPESHDISLLVWRALSMWVGGIMVVMVFMYMLPMFGIGRSVFYNELSGSGSSNYSVRMRNAAMSFVFSYGVLSLINLALLLLCGLDPMDAFCLMCSTISTGGLMITNDSMMSFPDSVQIVTILFMFLGGTNFYLHYRALYKREKGVYRSNSEFRTMVLWFLGISVIVYLLVAFSGHAGEDMTLDDHLHMFKDSLFTTVSLGTTTGLYVDDFTLYPAQCSALLMIVALIGASSGSTSGGIKFSRLRIIYEFLRNSFDKLVHPDDVYDVKMDGVSVDNGTVMSAVTVFLMYICTLIVGAVVFMIYGIGMTDAFGLSISGVSNGGMGFGNFGPSGNYAALDDPVKMVLIVLMWVGRLEIITALVLLTPSFWKELLSIRRYRKVRRYRAKWIRRSMDAEPQVQPEPRRAKEKTGRRRRR